MPPKPRPHTKSSTSGGIAGLPNWALGAAAVGLAGIVIAVVLLAGGGDGDGTGGREGVRSTLLAAGCTFEVVNALPGEHILAADGTSDKWNTDPPTSGPHHENAARFGAYTSPVNQAQLVHNLEHGGIAMQYGKDVSDETVAELQAFYEDHEPGTILAPLDELGDQIALGAWNVNSETDQKGLLAKCPTFDEKAFTAFFDEFQFKGPERFPRDALLPGQ
ncbi:MAG: DUF3105 domain-containing protein [Gaiella sp.]